MAWRIDNKLTRKISPADPVVTATINGVVAGCVNVVLALMLGAAMPSTATIGAAAVVGFLGVGVRLVLFMLALRYLGTARTGAYFSLAPFIGAVIAVGLLGVPVTVQFVAAGGLMGVDLWLHLVERHEHEHLHEATEHEHAHDEHHQHGHDEPVTKPHSHWHRHEPLRHSHPHYPDFHHQHHPKRTSRTGTKAPGCHRQPGHRGEPPFDELHRRTLPASRGVLTVTTMVMEIVMQEIKLREAKATLSAVIDQACRGQPSVITRHGRPEAVLLSFEEWQRLSQVPSFGRLLMAAPIADEDLPARRDGLRDAGL